MEPSLENPIPVHRSTPNLTSMMKSMWSSTFIQVMLYWQSAPWQSDGRLTLDLRSNSSRQTLPTTVYFVQ
uniref:Uncharacterized protein n=1 Tax=Romanomermis culicivorax TaxID=13658 RepID=A0A915I0R6_ROMCU